jgi:HK97 family phage portal protein
MSGQYINTGSFRGLNIFRRGNDRYTQTPNLHMNFLNLFKKSAQYISIDGKESFILRTTPQLNAVIYKRALMMSNGRWKHYKKNGELIKNSKIVKLLNRPNPFQTGKEFIIQNDIQKSTYGNSLMYMLRGSSLADPSALWNLSMQHITVERTGKIYNMTEENEIVTKYVLEYEAETGGTKIEFEPHEVLHRNIQDVDDPILGISPFHALKMPISNIRAAYGYRNVIMNEKGALGILSNNSSGSAGALPLTEAERKKIDQAYTKNYGISERQRKILMTNASLLWQPMSYPTKDMMLFEEITENFRIIIDKYGMDEALFSVNGVTFENKKEAKKAVYEDTIIPEAEDFAFGMTKKLNLDQSGEYLELCFKHIPSLQADQVQASQVQKNKAETAKTMKETDGLWTDDEIKETVNLIPGK